MLKNAILQDAVTLAGRHGLRGLTRRTVARWAKCGTGTINYHFKSMNGLRNAVVDYAIQNSVLEVLAQALAEKHKRAEKLTPDLRARVAAHIAGR